MHIEVDGINVTGAISIPSTGGLQIWQTIVVENIPLTAGKRAVRIVFDADNVQLDYIKFDKSTLTGLQEDNEMTDGITLSSNPFSSEGFLIHLLGDFSYSIHSMRGKLMEHDQGENKQLAGNDLNPGVYLLSVESRQSNYTRKIVRQ